MNLTADGQAVMENRYRYDAVDNILGITNAANPTSLTKLNKAKLGGKSSHTYEYDELNRLVHANGKAKSASYDMVMSFGRMSEPLTKVQKVDSTTTAGSYNFAYKYEDSNHPTAPTQIGHDHYTYDVNGNPILVENVSLNSERRMYPSVGGYVYCMGNPTKLIDPNGKETHVALNKDGTYSVVGGILNRDRNIYIFDKDNYHKKGFKTATERRVAWYKNKMKESWYDRHISSTLHPIEKVSKQ